jgi:hypothetical protein
VVLGVSASVPASATGRIISPSAATPRGPRGQLRGKANGSAPTIRYADCPSCSRSHEPSLWVRFKQEGDWRVSPPGSRSFYFAVRQVDDVKPPPRHRRTQPASTSAAGSLALWAAHMSPPSPTSAGVQWPIGSLYPLVVVRGKGGRERIDKGAAFGFGCDAQGRAAPIRSS